ncbi:MAG: 6-phosphofructokinase [Phycisphaerales bacterium]|nr:MAG: 6-phosphofructokinase [Phycisphaerales bacterium]
MTTDIPAGAAVVAQSGGPTAVINQSLVGVVAGLRPALESGLITRVYGARHGVRGMIEDSFVDLGAYPPETLEAVGATPSAALGSTRDKPDAAYCARIVESLKKRDARFLFYIGGNDSSDTCRIVSETARREGHDIRCFHVPKTIDNDLKMNDHTPGFPSAARFVATAFMGDDLDNRAIPGIKINIVMGRHAGFLTGASALARTREGDGPHVVCLPETPFDLDAFTAAVEGAYREHGRCLVAVSEGVQNAAGEPIAVALSSVERERDAHGNVQLSGVGALGDLLSEHLKKALASKGGKPPRVRADTFGYMQRYWPDPSPVDACEARGVGAFAAACALEGKEHGSVAIVRASSEPYKAAFELVQLTDVAAKTRHMDPAFIGEGFDVTPAYLEYLRPLVGTLPGFARL